MKFTNLHRYLCVAALLLTFVECARPQSKTPPATSVDLSALGVPNDFFNEKYCNLSLNHVANLVWLDDQRLVFAFSTNQACGGSVTAAIRLVSLDLAGKKLASIDIPYDAGSGGSLRVSPANAAYKGPDDTIVVQSVAADSTARLSVLSQNLETLQQLDLPSESGKWFERVTSGHHWIILRTPGANAGDDYTYYSGVPLVPVGILSTTRAEAIGLNVGEMQVALIRCGKAGCDGNYLRVRSSDGSSWSYTEPKLDHDLNILDWLTDGSLLVDSRKHSNNSDSQVFILRVGGSRTDLARIPRQYWAEVSFGFSLNNSRVAIGGYHENESCEGLSEVLPLHCRRLHKIFVYEQASRKPIFEQVVRGTSRAALSPDGRHLSVLDDNKLLIYTLP